jgi:membrane protein
MQRIKHAVDRLDETQRSRPWLAFPAAVVKKFGDDRAGDLAALIAYYGFFSLFPLLLALVTVLGLVLQGDPALRQRIVDSALSSFPIIGGQLQRQGRLHQLKGSGIVLAFSLAAAVWSGLGVIRASQNAMDDVWDVPKRKRQGFLPSVLRALGLLTVFALALGILGVLSGIGASAGSPSALRWTAVVMTFLMNVALFSVAFRLLTVADVSWRDVLPGAIVAAVGWTILQLLGSYLVGRELSGATEVYGFFAIVIGLLWWIYLAAQLTLFAAEVNVVRSRGLWPRSMAPPPLTAEDRRALTRNAREEEQRPSESVDVRFDRSEERR